LLRFNISTLDSILPVVLGLSLVLHFILYLNHIIRGELLLDESDELAAYILSFLIFFDLVECFDL
jgi:hypothetical protein